MKFREFVGEEEIEKAKKKIKKHKPVISNIEKIEESFFDEYFGFGLSKIQIKRIFDYIRSWFIRYKIPFEVNNPYLTLYLLNNLPSMKNRKYLIDAIRKSKRDVLYYPKGTITVISDDKKFPKTIDMNVKNNKDYIVLDFYPNYEYEDMLEKIFEATNINILKRYCHIKLFEVDSGYVSRKFYEDMMYSSPNIPSINLNNVAFTRRK